MLPPLAILLLLGSVAAANNVRPCVTSLIRGVTTEEVNFDHNVSRRGGRQLTVRCAGNSSLKAIKLHSGPDSLHSTLYDSLTCDNDKGWTANMYSPKQSQHDVVADATSPVTISCFEYCAVESMSADLVIRTSLEDVSTLSVECPDQRDLFYNSDHVGSVKLTCSKSDGWMYHDSVIMFKYKTTPMRFECRDPYAHCDTSLIKGIRLDQVAVTTDDKGDVLLTCVDGAASLSEISFEHKHHPSTSPSLTCGPEGWKDNFNGSIAAKNSSSLDISCYEYCALVVRPGLRSQRVRVKVEHTMADHSHVVTCADAGEQLFYEGEQVPRNVAMCTKQWGWYYYNGKNHGHLLNNEDATMEGLECRKDSSQRGKRFSRTEKEEKEETRA